MVGRICCYVGSAGSVCPLCRAKYVDKIYWRYISSLGQWETSIQVTWSLSADKIYWRYISSLDKSGQDMRPVWPPVTLGCRGDIFHSILDEIVGRVCYWCGLQVLLLLYLRAPVETHCYPTWKSEIKYSLQSTSYSNVVRSKGYTNIIRVTPTSPGLHQHHQDSLGKYKIKYK